MGEKKISQLTTATSVNSNDVVVIVQSGVTKKAPISLLPKGTAVGEYTISFEEAYRTQVAKNKYGDASNVDNSTKYLKDALTTALSSLNAHGGGTLLFEKMYTYKGSSTPWQIDNVNNITFKGVGQAGFQKPSGNSGRFGFIRHCNNLKFINMTFAGGQTQLSKLVAGDYGVEIHSGDTIIFEECTFKNMNDACLIVGNETSSETDGLDHTKNVWVTKCKFLNTWQCSTTQNGVYNYWFTNNYIKGGAAKFAQRKPNGDNLHILDNVFVATDNFTGNLIEMCNYNNVWIENNTMIGVKGITDAGLSIYYNTHANTDYYSTHKNITIKGNKIYDCKNAMWLGHAVSKYPGGRLYIENNTVMGTVSNRAMTLSGYWDTIYAKNNYFKGVSGSGIVIGQSGGSAHVIKRLFIEDNTFVECTGSEIVCTQVVNHLKLVNNYVNKTAANNIISLGDGTNAITIGIFELRDNRLSNTGANKNIINNNNATLTITTIKNNIITCASVSINNLSSPKVFLSGNYFDNTNSSACVVFKNNSSGNVYTCNNVNKGTLVTANGMTTTAQ